MLNLKKFLTVGVALASICVANATSLFGDCCCVEPSSYLSVSGGWRRDEIKGSVRQRHHGDDSSDSSSSSNNNQGRKHRFNAKDLNTWEIGVNLHAQMPEWCDCGCDGSNWWLRQFYVRGYAYRGWITDGKLHAGERRHHNNNVNPPVGTNVGLSDSDSGSSNNRRHGSVRDGKTIDGTIAVGFLYPVCDGFAIGPVGGYSYDEIQVKARHRNHNNNDSSSSSSDHHNRNRFRFTEKWRGGFVGFDSSYNWCWCDNQIQFDFGYEYHFAQLRASARQHDNRGHSGDNNSNHFNGNNAWGNVVWVDAHYNICDCWDAILGFNYKNFQTKKSHNHDSKWWSYGLTLDLGYRF